MQNKYIIIGKNGQLGSALARQLGSNALAFSHSDCDFSNIDEVRKILSGINAKAIFNACAYTAVDKAETEYDEALKANAKIPAALAQYCTDANIPLVHYSTDYVYSGEGEQPHTEREAPCPVNKYGQSKLEGEREIERIGEKYLIFRTSWVYDAFGKNFANTMLRLASEREELAVVADQIGAPTYAADLAKQSINALNNAIAADKFPSGVYHLCNNGQTSWYGFATQIFKIAKQLGISLKINNVKAIPTSDYPTPAKRPLNSRLDCSKAKSVLKVQMPDWHDSLEKCMEQIVESNKNTTQRSAGC